MKTSRQITISMNLALSHPIQDQNIYIHLSDKVIFVVRNETNVLKSPSSSGIYLSFKVDCGRKQRKSTGANRCKLIGALFPMTLIRTFIRTKSSLRSDRRYGSPRICQCWKAKLEMVVPNTNISTMEVR